MRKKSETYLLWRIPKEISKLVSVEVSMELHYTLRCMNLIVSNVDFGMLFFCFKSVLYACVV